MEKLDVKGLNLQQKMLLVSSEVMNVEKNTTVRTGDKSSYKAVADYDVVVAVKRAEAKYGIISVPVSQEIVDSQIMSYTDSRGYQKTQFVDVVKMTMEIINADNADESITVTAFGRGIDAGDKGFGKASTYARKYCLLNAYKIATGEDPDKDASEERCYSKPTAPVAEPAAPVAEPSAPVAQSVSNEMTLEKAIEMVNAAKTESELTDIWIRYRKEFGKEVAFAKAIAMHPANPKKGRSSNK